MCGDSYRVSQGGSIAVLRPTTHLRETEEEEEMCLLFQNRCPTVGTSVEFQGLGEHFQQNRHWVVIHRNGDLSAQSLPFNPLYSFSLDSASEATMQLPQKLDLGVGGSGIIGRRITVMTGSMQSPLTVAEGIIGWN